MSDNRTPKKGHTEWGTGLGRIHLVHSMTGRCMGCKKKVAKWVGQQDMTVQEVKETDFGLCSFVSDFWLDQLTN